MQHENNDSTAAMPSAGVLRRVASVVYDCLPILALSIIATFAFVPFLHGRVLVPREVGALAYAYWLVLLCVIGGFYVFFWIRMGQTVGMLPWRLRMQTPEGALIDWKRGIVRVLVNFGLWAPFFLGYGLIWGHWPHGAGRTLAMIASALPVALALMWIWIDRDGLAWQDRWTHTRVVVLPRRKR